MAAWPVLAARWAWAGNSNCAWLVKILSGWGGAFPARPGQTARVNKPQLSLEADGSVAYQQHYAEHLAQLVSPMDDMWLAFAGMASAHGLLVDGKLVGSCCVDDDSRLLHFYVQPEFRQHSVALLRLALAEYQVGCMITYSMDPQFLSAAMDVASNVKSHSLVYRHVAEPEQPALEGLRVGQMNDWEMIVQFQMRELGAPRAFLDGYVRTRLEGEEMLLLVEDGELICVGEVRPSQAQSGVAHLGLVVQGTRNGKGLGTRLFTSLLRRSQAAGWEAHCSTTCENLGAQRAIERTGFRADHRVLQIEHSELAKG
jgi:GNAT superfamily N-acetyltransferase